MPIFSYKGLTKDQERVIDTLEADSRKHAILLLKKQAITVLSIKEAQSHHRSHQRSLLPKKKTTTRKRRSRLRKGSVGLSFLSKLLDLHKNGMQVPDCIQLMRQRVSDPVIQDIAQRVWQDLSEGLLLDRALGKMPQYFNTPTLRLIEAGERTSNLSPILENVVEYLEEREAIRKKVLSGLAYPAVVCMLTIILAGGFIFVLLPKIEEMIESLGSEKNLLTQILIGIGDYGLPVGAVLGLLALILFITLKQWRNTDRGRWQTDQWLLRMPLIGAIVLKSELYQFTNLLGTLFQSGITATEGLRLSEKTLNNTVLLEKLRRARSEINEGHGFADSFRKHDFFPDTINDIITIGESVGNLVKSLRDVNQRLREELTAHMQLLTVTITATALGSAFLLVGMTAIGMTLSIFQVSQGFSG